MASKAASTVRMHAHLAAATIQARERGRRTRRAAECVPELQEVRPLKRTLELEIVDINRLSDVDIIKQRFTCEFVTRFTFKGGARDEHLNKAGAEFPFDSHGKPTFRPSALWYAKQVDFNNAHEYTTLGRPTRSRCARSPWPVRSATCSDDRGWMPRAQI